MTIGILTNNYNNHIEIYDNALTKQECELLINLFELDKSKHIEGKVIYNTGGISDVDHFAKKSVELDGSRLTDNSIISNVIGKSIKEYIIKYNEKYKALDTIAPWKCDDRYNVQKYTDETDGFKIWHCDGGSNPSSSRILVWMFYLNDAKSGTDFMYHSTVQGKLGRCVIWPATWDYTHRSQLPNEGLKYIVTGWVSYVEQPGERALDK